MSNSLRNPDARPKPPTAANPDARPRIWVEGRQQPKFDFRAWAGVSLIITRRKLAPAMTSGAQRIGRFGEKIRRGDLRPNLAWAGRAQRFIPSHQSAGGFVLGCARLIEEAREVVQPTPPPAEPIAYPNLIRPDFHGRQERSIRALRQQAEAPQPSPAPEPPPPAPAQPDETALRAIRSLIGETGPEPRPLPRRSADPDTQAPTRLARARAAVAGAVHRVAATGLAWGLTALAFPLGGIQAALFHLNGGDLKDWS